MSGLSRAAIGALVAIVAGAASSRWHRRWGASDAEVADVLPGDDLVQAPEHQTTRAITIDCPPEAVWPWLVQMGQGRAGLYTYESIENALGAHIRNLDRIDPNLQRLQVGDPIRLTPELYLGRLPGQFYAVEEIRPNEALCLLQELPGGGMSSWSFVLRPTSGERTRLLVRARTSRPPSVAARLGRRVELLLFEPGYFVMERGMLLGIARRAQSLSRRPNSGSR